MSRQSLIDEIFEHFPHTYKGLNNDGQHVVQIIRRDMAMYATLEKLSNGDLEALAEQLAISIADPDSLETV